MQRSVVAVAVLFMLGSAACSNGDPCTIKGAERDENQACRCPDGTHTQGRKCVPDDAGLELSPSTGTDAGPATGLSQLDAGGTDAGRDASRLPVLPQVPHEDAGQPTDAGEPADLGAPADTGTPSSAKEPDAAAVIADAGPPPPSCVATPETCDGKDNDCDGTIDNGVKNECGACGKLDHAKGEACTNGGQGPCAKPGTYQCMGELTVCSAPPASPSAEICDGIDNDCDGVADDGIVKNTCQGCAPLAHAKGEACSDGVGECKVDGAWDCVGTESVVCTAKARAAGTEVCDGKDNDCDGQVDEQLFNACGGPCRTPVPAEDCSTAADDNCNGQANEGCAVCGDGQVTAPEECDPTATGWTPWTCSTDCKRNTMYGACATDADCFGAVGRSSVICNTRYGVCSIMCPTEGALGAASGCPAPPGNLTAQCTRITGESRFCFASGCTASNTPGAGGCAPKSTCAANDQASWCVGS